jgi:outer membrane receptor protein involved in Fe transport
MVINAGIRYDVFSVGDQLSASVVENRIRDQWSPRLGIAYPVTHRDVLSFHYGRFSQVPNRQYIFENRSSAVPVRGNPNLENQTTVAYQAALQHMFGEAVFGQFTVYFKDIFGWISTEDVQSGDSPQLVTQFVNKDYASSRGFEISLTKRFNGYFSGDLAYSYGVATGLASDPNVQQQVDFLYLPIAEQPLNWDQRHTVSVSGTAANPHHWSVSVLWNFGTGFPYTPRFRNERQFDPARVNSGRLPTTSTLTIQAEKHFRIWGQAIRFFLRGHNILNTKNIRQLSPQNWPPPPGTLPTDYEVFYTETGRAGGAFQGEDLNEDGIKDWVALNDPRVFAEGRSVRLGVGMSF